MADDMRDLVLDHLKTIQSRPSAIELDMGDVRMRVSTMEQYPSQVLSLPGGLHKRMDRFDERAVRTDRAPS